MASTCPLLRVEPSGIEPHGFRTGHYNNCWSVVRCVSRVPRGQAGFVLFRFETVDEQWSLAWDYYIRQLSSCDGSALTF